MTTKTTLILATACVLSAVPASANAATTISITGSSIGVCTNSADGYCYLRQDFGDTAAMDISYERVNSTGAVTGLAHRTINFGDLGNTIGAGTNEFATSFGRITMRAAAGYQLSLLGFDFASYFLFAPTIPISIRDLSGNSILAGTFPTGNGSLHKTLAVNSAFVDGVVIDWGPRANVVGLDNIRYETRLLAAVVPEPATWAMLIAGFGIIGGAMRRRTLPLRSPAIA